MLSVYGLGKQDRHWVAVGVHCLHGFVQYDDNTDVESLATRLELYCRAVWNAEEFMK